MFQNNHEREKGPYFQFHKLYDSGWVVTTDFCSIYLVEGKANETLRDIFSFMRRRIEKMRMIFCSFTKFCIVTVTKLVLAARKSVIVFTISYTKFAKILIMKIKFLKLTVKTNGFAATA